MQELYCTYFAEVQLLVMAKEPQQHTLSIRIPEDLRGYLERVKKMFSSMGQSVSISDVAKTLLEKAKAERIEDLAGLPELFKQPTQTLAGIRRKWDQKRIITRGEWVLLAHYVQISCEESGSDFTFAPQESLAQLLEAFLAVMEVVIDRTLPREGYYLKNLELHSYSNYDPESMPMGLVEATKLVIQKLREPGPKIQSAIFGRNLYVALSREEFQSIAAVNEALAPFLAVLYRLAARGHWITEKRPVRYSGQPMDYGFVPVNIPPITAGNFRLTTYITGEGDLTVALSLPNRKAVYPLGPFPQIREFAAMLRELAPGEHWTGHEFFAYTDAYGRPDDVTEYCFRHRMNGIIFGFSLEEWEQLTGMFEQLFTLPELKPVLAELALQYGEI